VTKTKQNLPNEALDDHLIAASLRLARRGLGRVWPNPAVGCVLVRPDLGSSPFGRIVGRGWTQPFGRPHGETEALLRAGDLAAGATAYVSLEPCAHFGETPPCAQALIDAGVVRVVASAPDPDPRVSGQGMAMLEAAGIDTTMGVRQDEAEALNAGFILATTLGRPLVTLKLATTLDGCIATHRGESRWITGVASRRRVQGLRMDHDAVLIGSGTALADDPMLDCRLEGLEDFSPLRIVIDSRLRLALTSRLVMTASARPTWILTRQDAEPLRAQAFRECGLQVIEIGADGDHNLDLLEALKALGERGITRLLVEGGSHLAASMIRADLVDRLVWFRSPRLMGGDGISATAPFGVDRLSQTADFTPVEHSLCGEDTMEVFERATSTEGMN
jgi:diaminohydroxyphosphoribosylaminopyrimidine deaminase / 5-amino-6-(5-phosphoribosylamino)uracil reductase